MESEYIDGEKTFICKEDMTKTYTIRIEPEGKVLQAEAGRLFSEILRPEGLALPCGGKGLCGNCRIELLEGKIGIDEAQRTLLVKKGYDPARWRLACWSRVTDSAVIRLPLGKNQILTDGQEYRSQTETGVGVAVDVGSTTLVVQSIDLQTGQILFTRTALNRQSAYGSDIISRIAYALESEEKATRLCLLIRKQLGELIGQAVQGCEKKVRKVALVGNSAMHHLFGGLDVKPLSAFPFQSPHNEACTFTASDLRWNLPDGCTIQFLPNISHFVGSDILAGIYHLGIPEAATWNALVDLGTNGEIVIGNRRRIVCASTAAGPAFEGVHITQGMRAVSGAIAQVGADGSVEVIDGGEAKGICGSGLIDAIHYFRATGRIDESGTLTNPDDTLSLTPQVRLTEQDVREFQLAKSAIATGFQLLTEHLGITPRDITHIYLSGGLGHYANISHALALGLLPDVTGAQIVQAGNTALAGCKRFLTSSEVMAPFDPPIEHLALETIPNFQDAYCDHLYF